MQSNRALLPGLAVILPAYPMPAVALGIEIDMGICGLRIKIYAKPMLE